MRIRTLFTIIIFAIIGFVVHTLLFSLMLPKIYEENFIYSLVQLYSGFTLTSLLIVFVLVEIRKRNIDNVGLIYLWLTSVKMIVAYFFLRPILAVNLPKTPTEKMSFFIIFIYFLTIETFVTIRILNNKQ